MSLCESSDGIVFPNLDNSSKPPSKRSTTTTARSIYQTAIDAAADNENKSSFQIPPNKKWRYGYQPTVVHTSHLMTAHSSNPLTMARAALQHAHTTFQFRRSGFPEMSLQEACTQDTFTGSFVTGDSTSSTATSAASSTTSTDPCFTGVPYRGKEYRGAELIDLAQSFADYGQAEPSFALAIKNIMNTDTLKKGLADKVFILIGATSEMGPTQSLLDLGATVIALARPSSKRDPDKWKRLINKAVNSSGTMLYPTRSTDASVAGAGADALVDTPEIINWLCELSNSHPMVQNKQMYIYSGIYLDGGMFVRASMAMEMIISELTKRLIQIPNLIYIDTPSHAHIVDLATYTGGIDQQQHAPFLMKLMASCGIIKKNKCILNPSGRKDVVVMNMLATQQGPNYALAKFIQRFRAIWSRHSETLLFPNDQNKGKLVVIYISNGMFPKQYSNLTLLKIKLLFLLFIFLISRSLFLICVYFHLYL